MTSRGVDRLAAIKEGRLEDPYVTGGNRVYVIGTQSGGFPDLGCHVPGEMGGVWDHPIKLLDGFWLNVRDTATGEEAWVQGAVRFIHSVYYDLFEYALDSLGLTVRRWQFVPDDEEALLVQWSIEAAQEGIEGREFELTVLARTDLLPVWGAGHVGLKDAIDVGHFDSSNGIVVARDGMNPWYAVFGAERKPVHADVGKELRGPEQTRGGGIGGALSYRVTLEGSLAELWWAVAGSTQDEESARKTWRRVLDRRNDLIANKRKRLEALLETARLEAPDPLVQETFDWVKLGTDVLVRKVDGVGQGLGAGIPEYPWWFACDSSYALMALLPCGLFELVQDTFRILARFSELHSGDGRIPHEISTCQWVSNPGNTQETPQFVKAVYQAYLWSGDDAFLKELYPLCRKAVKEWTFGISDTDGDLFPEGYGIMEVAGLNWEMIDNAVYGYEALVALRAMAERLGDEETAAYCWEREDRLKVSINARFWLEEEGLYADMIASPRVLLDRLDEIRGQHAQRPEDSRVNELLDTFEARAQSLPPDEEVPWLFSNWVILCPLEAEIAPEAWARRQLSRMESDEFSSQWGLYLNGTERRTVMTISTAVMAVAEAAYGRTDQALDYVRRISRTRDLRLPGCPSEISPDGGCFVQAWTNYGVVWPIVAYFFGLRPDAGARRLRVKPHLPAEWPEASLQDVRVGGNTFSFEVAKQRDGLTLIVEAKDPGWELELDVGQRNGVSARLNGIVVDVGRGAPGNRVLGWRSTGRDEIEVRWKA